MSCEASRVIELFNFEYISLCMAADAGTRNAVGAHGYIGVPPLRARSNTMSAGYSNE